MDCLKMLHDRSLVVYLLLMTLLVMMVQLVLVMRPQLMVMLAASGDGYRKHGGMVLVQL